MKMTGCLKEFIRYSSFNVLGMLGLSCYVLCVQRAWDKRTCCFEFSHTSL